MRTDEVIGYSRDYTPNKHWKQQGLICEWEHCIENMPLPGEGSPMACPVFGHCCPGGVEKVVDCGKTIDDVPAHRFASPEAIGARKKEMGL